MKVLVDNIMRESLGSDMEIWAHNWALKNLIIEKVLKMDKITFK